MTYQFLLDTCFCFMTHWIIVTVSWFLTEVLTPHLLQLSREAAFGHFVAWVCKCLIAAPQLLLSHASGIKQPHYKILNTAKRKHSASRKKRPLRQCFPLTVYSLFVKTFRHTELSLWTSHWNNGIHNWVRDAACTLNITQWGSWLKTKFWRSLLFTRQQVQIWLARLMMSVCWQNRRWVWNRAQWLNLPVCWSCDNKIHVAAAILCNV